MALVTTEGFPGRLWAGLGQDGPDSRTAVEASVTSNAWGARGLWAVLSNIGRLRVRHWLQGEGGVFMASPVGGPRDGHPSGTIRLAECQIGCEPNLYARCSTRLECSSSRGDTFTHRRRLRHTGGPQWRFGVPAGSFFALRRIPLSVPASVDVQAKSARVAGLRRSVGAGVWFALALFCLLQALPLPLSWLSTLAPDQADIWSRSLKPFGLPPPDFASLSLAPHRTLIEALKMASYGVIFGVSARLSRRGVGHLVQIVFLSALAVALVTAAHQLLGAERLFGVYQPSNAPTVAPLLNPNSRAGYLNLGFFCGLGLLFRAGNNARGALIGVGLVFLVAEILLCQSRGGTGCLVLGMLLVIILRPRNASGEAVRGLELGWRWQALIVVLIGVGATLMALFARREGGLGYDESISKLDVLARAGRLALDHLTWGVGRGAFGSAFSTYQSGAGVTVYEHAENLPLQWAAEWGMVVTILAFCAIGWSFWPVFSRATLENPLRRCTLVGAVVLVGQNFVDLGLEIPAVAALLACVLGGLVGAASPLKRPDTEGGGRLLLAGSALTALCIGLALAFGSESPARERARLHEVLAATKGAPPAEFWEALQHAVRAYPADPYFPLLGTSAALAARQNAIPWAARALERAPTSGPAHLALGRALHARGATGQAIGALRRAAELDPNRAFAAISLGVEWKVAPEALVAAIPDGPAGAPLLRMLADASPDSPQRLRWMEAALERDPSNAELHYRTALELYRDLSKKDRGAICRDTRDECLRRAVTHVGRASQPPNPRSAILEAQLVELSEGPVRAEEQLVAACSHFPGDEACAKERVTLALRNKSPQLPGAVRVLVASGCATPERCAETHFHLGQQFAGQGQWNTAASHFRQATIEMPTAQSWRAFAGASKQLGQDVRAEDALRRAELLDGEKKGGQ